MDSGRDRRTSVTPGPCAVAGHECACMRIWMCRRRQRRRARERKRLVRSLPWDGGREVCESDCRHKLGEAFITRNNLRRNFHSVKGLRGRDRSAVESRGRGQSAIEKCTPIVLRPRKPHRSPCDVVVAERAPRPWRPPTRPTRRRRRRRPRESMT